MDFLDPFEIDDRHDADLQIRVPGDVDLVGDGGAMQALVEEEIAAGRKLLPGGEGPRRAAVKPLLFRVVDVMACPPAAVAAVVSECLLQLLQEIVLRAEMTEMLVAVSLGGALTVAHVLA